MSENQRASPKPQVEPIASKVVMNYWKQKEKQAIEESRQEKERYHHLSPNRYFQKKKTKLLHLVLKLKKNRIFFNNMLFLFLGQLKAHSARFIQ